MAFSNFERNRTGYGTCKLVGQAAEMGKFMPTSEDEQILGLVYFGYVRERIVKETGYSAGYIHNLIQREEELLGAGNVKAFRRLISSLAEVGYGPVDIMKAIRFISAYRARYDVGIDSVIEMVPKIIYSCKTMNVELEDLLPTLERRIAQFGF